MTHVIEFDTARLHLRQWRLSDRPTFAALNVDRAVMEFFPATLDRQASDQMAERIATGIAQRGWGLWAVEIRGGDPFIGFVGLNIPGYPVPASPCVEIGWRLARAHWGRGYASEAARAALRIGFETLGLPEIVSFTALGNLRSRAVMERIGMRAHGERFAHPLLDPKHPLSMHVLYCLSGKEWLKQSSQQTSV